MTKILATVIKISENFFADNQDVSVFITGSTPSRTRLYQIAISTNLPLLSMTYEIYGFRDSSWETFQKNATYEAFLVQKLF